ncbi:MAG: glycosyltransferase [Holophagales bacterium]|nr:glycosyltransferase [Holophagales bacterium]
MKKEHEAGSEQPTDDRGAEVSITVPTVGRSPCLERSLRALRSEVDGYGGPAEVVLVVPPGLEVATASRDRVDRVVEVERPGFAAANNRAFVESQGALWATVNDDAVVQPGWLRALVEVLRARADAAAVQGWVLRLDVPQELDGTGIAWNRWWQAVQIGHGQAEGAMACRVGSACQGTPSEVFGVSATAALYRRSDLLAVSTRDGPFDESLWAYYEDVDLAWRLRARGKTAWSLPQARALHVGSATGRTLAFGGRQLIHGNRHRVLARHLGREYLARLPRILGRDALDFLHRLRAGDPVGAAGIAVGLARAIFGLPRFVHFGVPRPPLAEVLALGSSSGDPGSGKPMR